MECPQCGEIAPEVLSEGRNLTLQCEECGTVYKVPNRKLRLLEIPLVVSEGDRSSSNHIQTPADETITLDDEFELDGHRMKVTAIQIADDRYVRKCVASDVKLLHAILFDTVTVKITVNEGETTRSLRLPMEPEAKLSIRAILRVDGERLRIKTLKSNENRTVRSGHLLAKNCVRVFADPADKPKSKPWSKQK